jgi:hypothetical protein
VHTHPLPCGGRRFVVNGLHFVVGTKYGETALTDPSTTD